MVTNALVVETALFFNVIRQADGIADSAKDRAKHFTALPTFYAVVCAYLQLPICLLAALIRIMVFGLAECSEQWL